MSVGQGGEAEGRKYINDHNLTYKVIGATEEF